MMKRQPVVACAAAMLLLWAEPSLGKARPRRAQRTCQSTYKRALKLERAGQLLRAQDELQGCAKAACGAFLKHRCLVKYDQIVSDTPSVVPVVTDQDGAFLTDVQVTMDGELLTSHADGRATSIDPGLHQFSFKRDKTVLATQHIVVLQGQRNRPIRLRLEPPSEEAADEEPAPARATPSKLAAPEKTASATLAPAAALSAVPHAEPKRASYLGSYLLIGSGLVAIGGFGLLTYWGRSDNDQLAQCAPNCSQASVDHIRDLYLAANISLGVGIAAVVGGSWLAWRTHSRYSMSVQPTPSGAYASLAGAF